MDVWNDLESNPVDFYAAMRSASLQTGGQSGRSNAVQEANQAAQDFEFGVEDEDEIYNEMETK